MVSARGNARTFQLYNFETLKLITMKWYLWLVLGAAIGYVGYMMWKRNRDAKMVAALSGAKGVNTTAATTGLMTGTGTL